MSLPKFIVPFFLAANSLLLGVSQAAPLDTQIVFDEALVTQALADASVADAAGKTAWDKAITIAIDLSEYAFSPSQLKLKLNQAYLIKLKNVGKKTHDFVADNFFKAVAAESVVFFDSKGVEIGDLVPGYLKDIGLSPGASVEIRLIPVQPGTFYLLCEVPGHEGHGMHGQLEITP